MNRHVELKDYWQLLISIANLGPDLEKNPKIVFKEWKRPVAIDEYLDEIYVPRLKEGYEQNLLQEIQTTNRVLCIAGERGAGKTSAVCWVEREIKKADRTCRFQCVDVRNYYDSLDLGFLDTDIKNDSIVALQIERAFKKLIKNYLTQALFPEHYDLRKLVAWTVAGPPDDSQDFDSNITADLQDLYIKTSGIANWSRELTRKERIEHFLNEIEKDFAKYEKIIEISLERLRAAQVIHAYIVGNKAFKKLILVLDNVDRIPIEHQQYILSVARDIQRSCGSVCSTAISIRTENAFRYQLAKGDEKFYDLFLLDSQKYTGLLLPSLEGEHARKILNSREIFAQKILREYDAQNNSKHEKVLRDCISPFHRGIVLEFVEEKVQILANDSCRILLNLYVEFLRYIWTATGPAYKDKTGKALLDKRRIEDKYEKHLKTLFYLWLHERGQYIGIPLQDIVEHDFLATPGKFSDTASPRYLILTCIHNLKRELESKGLKEDWPIWGDVVSRMKELGFNYVEILKTMNSFIAKIGEPAGMLCLDHREIGTIKLSEIDNSQIMLTKFGRFIIEEVISKAGYIWGVARRRYEGETKLKTYYEYQRIERARHTYYFAKSLGLEHIRILAILKTEWKGKYGENWVREYRSKFGIFGNLQIESIIESALNFYSNLFIDEADNPFRLLKNTFTLLVNKMAGNELSKSDFDQISAGDDLIDRVRIFTMRKEAS